MNNYFKFLFLLFLIVGFANMQAQTAESGSQEQQEFFGEKFDVSDAISYEDMMKKLGKKKDLELVVTGHVLSVCQVKGCWMNITSTENRDAKPIFVKFKDYGFFMPLDLSGQNVIMKGKVYTEETSIEELRHYAEDAGKSKEEIAAITEPKIELKFLASGVKIISQ
jgi:hypothetical protein